VVGHAATISAGEWITASGDWVNDRTHGQQFRVRFLKTSEPTSVEGIEKYLASGMIRGIGPTYAKKLLRAFGEKVFEVIETQADRLDEVAVAPCLDPNDTEAVLGVLVGDPLDQPSQHLSIGWMGLRLHSAQSLALDYSTG
jgi:ATP-dependent exoDNAse (exonuclease V) alpha subunit